MEEIKEVTVELYSGSSILSETLEKYGFRTFTIDNEKKLPADRHWDMITVTPKMITDAVGKRIFALWASPPCWTFSIASLRYHWIQSKHDDNHIPKSDECKKMLRLVEHTMKLIEALNPVYWFVENPQGMMRAHSYMKNYEYYLNQITYCQYGEEYMKPTYIYTNAPIKFRRPCDYGMKCHKSVPAGDKGGIQSLKNRFERAKLPLEFCEEISQKLKILYEKGNPKIPTLGDF